MLHKNFDRSLDLVLAWIGATGSLVVHPPALDIPLMPVIVQVFVPLAQTLIGAFAVVAAKDVSLWLKAKFFDKKNGTPEDDR